MQLTFCNLQYQFIAEVVTNLTRMHANYVSIQMQNLTCKEHSVVGKE